MFESQCNTYPQIVLQKTKKIRMNKQIILPQLDSTLLKGARSIQVVPLGKQLLHMEGWKENTTRLMPPQDKKLTLPVIFYL
jgi:hypothetical protein